MYTVLESILYTINENYKCINALNIKNILFNPDRMVHFQLGLQLLQ